MYSYNRIVIFIFTFIFRGTLAERVRACATFKLRVSLFSLATKNSPRLSRMRLENFSYA